MNARLVTALMVSACAAAMASCGGGHGAAPTGTGGATGSAGGGGVAGTTGGDRGGASGKGGSGAGGVAGAIGAGASGAGGAAGVSGAGASSAGGSAGTVGAGGSASGGSGLADGGAGGTGGAAGFSAAGGNGGTAGVGGGAAGTNGVGGANGAGAGGASGVGGGAGSGTAGASPAGAGGAGAGGGAGATGPGGSGGGGTAGGLGAGGGAGNVTLQNLAWAALPAGTFQMGSPDGSDGPDNLPQHAVTVAAFDVTTTEVTVAAYAACIAAGGCRAPLFSRADDPRCNWTGAATEDRPTSPVNCISWPRSSEFCAWAGGRLPSEAEWEYAARSGGRSASLYPWGGATPSCLLAASDAAGCNLTITDPVCAHPNGDTMQGICDMAGNVWEWVQDVWVSGYAGAPTDGSARTTGGTGDRVQRGGGVDDQVTSGLKAVFRYHFSGDDDDAGLSLGFRCARAHQ